MRFEEQREQCMMQIMIFQLQMQQQQAQAQAQMQQQAFMNDMIMMLSTGYSVQGLSNVQHHNSNENVGNQNREVNAESDG